MPKLTFSVSPAGNILLPDGAPYDGHPVLVRFENGWCEAYWLPATVEYTSDGPTRDGFYWVCLGGRLLEEWDVALEWAPLPVTEPSLGKAL